MVTQKKLIDKSKNGKNVPSIEVVKADLVKCNLLDNYYQYKSKVLYSNTSHKSYAYLLNVEWSNLIFYETYNAEFDIIITFTDQNCRPLKIEVKLNLTLPINKEK